MPSSHYRKLLLNLLSAVLVAAMFYFLGRELYRNWIPIRSFPFHFNASLLIFASVIYAAAMFFLAIGWRLILKYLHYSLTLSETIVYFCITFPAKYIPGKIWLAVARMKFCKPREIPHSVTFLSTVVESVIEILAGAYISIIALLQTPILGKHSVLGTLIVSGVGVLLLSPSVFYFLINLYLKITKHQLIPKNKYVSFWKLLVLQLNYILAMFALGASQFVFLQSFVPVDISNFSLLLSVGVFSYIAGIIVLFSPGGLGVREGIWYFVLKNITQPHVALIYTFISRLWTVAVEIVLLLVCLPFLFVLNPKRRL